MSQVEESRVSLIFQNTGAFKTSGPAQHYNTDRNAQYKKFFTVKTAWWSH